MPDFRNICDFMSDTFLFKGIKKDKISEILGDITISVHTYQKGELIAALDGKENKLGFVFNGECSVLKEGRDGKVPINTIKRSGSFGIASMFSKNQSFPTKVIAKKHSEIIFFERQDVLRMICENSPISLNIIEFLSDRVSFLNGKMSTFSMSDCTGKLASLLVTECENKSTEILNFNCKSSAESLNIGRASLYRAIRSLCDMGYIEHENKKIIIKNLKGLKGISQ